MMDTAKVESAMENLMNLEAGVLGAIANGAKLLV